MNRFIAAVVASAFVFGTVSTYAATAAKDELTVEQRSDMRERAARMKEQGQQTVAPAQDTMQNKAVKTKRSVKAHKKHAKKVAKRSVRKAQRRA